MARKENDFDLLKEELSKELDHLMPEFIRIRQELHKIPEPAREEFKTSALIKEVLGNAGIEYKSEIGGSTGIAAIINGKNSRPVLAFRADMDALPIEEETELPYCSTIRGWMHACGHDFHISAVLAVGILLNKHRLSMPASIKLIFQPAEEDGPTGGAKLMIKEGVLESPRVDAIFAMHVFPSIPLGKIAVLGGPVMASADTFKIRITGSGGHAAFPNLAVDPINVAGHLIVAFNTLISKNISPLDSGVVNIGIVKGGSKRSVIPNSVYLEGTMRALKNETRILLRTKIAALCQGICSSMGASVDLDWEYSYDPTINDYEMADLAREGISSLLGQDSIIREVEPSMTSEDFAYFLREVPGAMIWAGAGEENKKMILHSSRLAISDEILSYMIKSYLGLLLKYLKMRSNIN